MKIEPEGRIIDRTGRELPSLTHRFADICYKMDVAKAAARHRKTEIVGSSELLWPFEVVLNGVTHEPRVHLVRIELSEAHYPGVIERAQLHARSG